MSVRHLIKDFYSKNLQFVKNLGFLVTSNSLVQILGFIAIPLLTRLYSPEDFGVLSIFAAVHLVIVAVATLRLELAIPNVKTDSEAYELMIFCGFFAVLTGLLTFLVLCSLFWSSDIFVELIGEHRALTWLLPLSVILGSLFNALVFLAVRFDMHQFIAAIRVKQLLVALGIQFVFGFFVDGPFGLLVAFLVQASFGLYAIYAMYRSQLVTAVKELTLARAKSSLSLNKRYGQFSVLEGLFHMGALQVPIIMVGSILGTKVAGLLYIALKVLGAPMAALSASFGQIFSADAPKYYANHQLKILTFKHLKLNSVMSLGSMVLLVGFLYFWGPSLLGPDWIDVIGVMLITLPFIAMQSIASPLGSILYVTANQSLALLVHVLGFVVRVLPFFLMSQLELLDPIITFSVTGFIHYLIYFITILCVIAGLTERKKNVI